MFLCGAHLQVAFHEVLEDVVLRPLGPTHPVVEDLDTGSRTSKIHQALPDVRTVLQVLQPLQGQLILIPRLLVGNCARQNKWTRVYKIL